MTQQRDASASIGRESALELAFAILLVVFCAFFVTHAWVVDDAYITFRCVDNFMHGFGLRWNVDERVQAYTHPLWMLLFAVAHFVTRDTFYTVLGLSFVASLAAIVVTSRSLAVNVSDWGPIVFLALLLSSRAFLDYSSSGLENPLTHLLIAAFFARFLHPRVPWQEAPPRQVVGLFLLASLAFVNRQDTVLYFAPACALVAFRQARAAGASRVLRTTLAASVPAVAWITFAVFYYGSAVPNTAFAKLTGPGLTFAEKLRAGVAYYLDSIFMDVATPTLCALAMFVAVRSRSRYLLAAAGGLVLYLVYVLACGAACTHMSGRFFSGAAVLAAILVAHAVRGGATAFPLLAFALIVIVGSPFSPLTVGSNAHARAELARGEFHVIDTRSMVLRGGAALLDFSPTERLPREDSYLAGLEFGRAPQRVAVGAPGPAQWMIGYAGFAAGPDKHIIDVLGLADPLLARLPIGPATTWRPGHFERELPLGYVTSVLTRTNALEDRDLHAYYDALVEVTRGPLFSGRRLATIWRLNTGAYEHHLDAYAIRTGLRPR